MADAGETTPSPGISRRRKIAFAAITFLIVLIVVEILVRLAFSFENQIKSLLGVPIVALDVYEVPDEHCGWLWALKPGFSQTLKEAIESKKKLGRLPGAEHLEKRGRELGIGSDDVIFQINQDGFIGPEIDKSHSRPRILTIGDSCTFGSLFNRYCYPRALERELQRRGHDVEVINAGVEGYGPKQVLARIDEFRDLKPEVVVIHIGWNAIFDRTEFRVGLSKYIRTWAAADRMLKAVWKKIRGTKTDPLSLFQRQKHPDRDARDVKRLSRYVPSFMGDVEKIAKIMKSSGSEVFITTLPGLYSMDDEPSSRALQIGHLPPYTDNPFVLARMAERYNAALRDFADRKGLVLIDIAGWARRQLRPSDQYFLDSVHLTEEAQSLLGKYLAGELEPFIAKLE